jgi:hypothetical protein
MDSEHESTTEDNSSDLSNTESFVSDSETDTEAYTGEENRKEVVRCPGLPDEEDEYVWEDVDPEYLANVLTQMEDAHEKLREIQAGAKRVQGRTQKGSAQKTSSAKSKATSSDKKGKSSSVPCRYFQAGKCNRAKCRFSHDQHKWTTKDKEDRPPTSKTTKIKEEAQRPKRARTVAFNSRLYSNPVWDQNPQLKTKMRKLGLRTRDSQTPDGEHPIMASARNVIVSKAFANLHQQGHTRIASIGGVARDGGIVDSLNYEVPEFMQIKLKIVPSLAAFQGLKDPHDIFREQNLNKKWSDEIHPTAGVLVDTYHITPTDLHYIMQTHKLTTICVINQRFNGIGGSPFEEAYWRRFDPSNPRQRILKPSATDWIQYSQDINSPQLAPHPTSDWLFQKNSIAVADDRFLVWTVTEVGTQGVFYCVQFFYSDKEPQSPRLVPVGSQVTNVSIPARAMRRCWYHEYFSHDSWINWAFKLDPDQQVEVYRPLYLHLLDEHSDRQNTQFSFNSLSAKARTWTKEDPQFQARKRFEPEYMSQLRSRTISAAFWFRRRELADLASGQLEVNNDDRLRYAAAVKMGTAASSPYESKPWSKWWLLGLIPLGIYAYSRYVRATQQMSPPGALNQAVLGIGDAINVLATAPILEETFKCYFPKRLGGPWTASAIIMALEGPQYTFQQYFPTGCLHLFAAFVGQHSLPAAICVHSAWNAGVMAQQVQLKAPNAFTFGSASLYTHTEQYHAIWVEENYNKPWKDRPARNPQPPTVVSPLATTQHRKQWRPYVVKEPKPCPYVELVPFGTENYDKRNPAYFTRYLPTGVVTHVPQKTPQNLMGVLKHRILKAAPYDQKRADKIWPLVPDLVEQQTEFDREACIPAYADHLSGRRKFRWVAGDEFLTKTGSPFADPKIFRSSFFTKTNEQLMRVTENSDGEMYVEFKPRAVNLQHPAVIAYSAPTVFAAAQRMKSIFNIKTTPVYRFKTKKAYHYCRVTNASGRDADFLGKWARYAIEWTSQSPYHYWLIYNGDDSVIAIQNGFFEGDYGMFDQSQSIGALQYRLRQLGLLGVPEDERKVLWRTTKFEFYTDVGKIRIKKQPHGYERRTCVTGGSDTTSGNGVAHQGAFLYAVSQEEVDFSRSYSLLGFDFKNRFFKEITAVSFLKGMWCYDNKEKLRWVPLPGMYLKTGAYKNAKPEILPNYPKDHLDACLTHASAVANTWAHYTLPPILRAFVWRFAGKTSIEDPLDEHKIRAGKIHSLPEQRTLEQTAERYGTDVETVLELEALIRLRPFPSFLDHRLLHMMRDRDYG